MTECQLDHTMYLGTLTLEYRSAILQELFRIGIVRWTDRR